MERRFVEDILGRGGSAVRRSPRGHATLRFCSAAYRRPAGPYTGSSAFLKLPTES